MFAITSYVVKDLRDLAAKLNLAGRSAMGKAELYEAVSNALDTAHGYALDMDAELFPASPVSALSVDLSSVDRKRGNVCEIVPAVTVADLLDTGWTRLPRKLKKSLRKSRVLV
jgi:ABC-type branched-subunit amino acid transport system ATPase component